MSPVKRRYDSPLRREQAAATRGRLIASARKLFVERGYSRTTIDAIAADAGVAPQTFYGAFGSKRAVLFAVLDEMAVDADPAAFAAAVAAAPGPAEQLALLVDYRVRLFTPVADFLAVVRAAGAAEPDLAALWEEGEARRRRNQEELVHNWATGEALRAGLSEAEAGDVLWALTGPDVHRLFMSDQGWTPERYTAWLTATLRGLLLDDAGTTGG